jgi:hypothetical protein
MKFSSILLVGSLALLGACGGGGGGSASKPQVTVQPTQPDAQMETEGEGQFIAVFQPLNQTLSGSISGSATFSKEAEDLFIDVRFTGKNPALIQSQYIHVGGSCPTMANDTNGDGFIDVNESYAVTGQIFVPLDGDISSQDRGSATFPLTDTYGAYSYYERTSYQRFFSDLQDGDLDPSDDIVKLGADKALAMNTRVVMIYGVPAEAILPPTVSTRGRLANFQTLPIACGVFTKVTAVPGTVDDDSGLGDAPSEGSTVGGSGGADDGTIVIAPSEPSTSEGCGFHWPWESCPTTGGTSGGGDYGNETSGGSHGVI